MALVQLKVKIKSLAAESTIIRKEEQKRAKRKGEKQPRSPEVIADRQSLQDHRRYVVREEARCSLLAYGYLRGRTYRSMEAKCYESPRWDKVESIVKRFKPAGANDIDINAWMKAGLDDEQT